MKAKVIFIIVLVLTIGLFCGLAIPAILNGDDSYKGKVVFNTEQEYAQFKTELIKSDASWSATNNDIEILNNEPPIIVTFDVGVSQDYNFPYGKVIHDQIFNLIFCIVIIAGSFVSAYFIIASCKEVNGKSNKAWLFTKDEVKK